MFNLHIVVLGKGKAGWEIVFTAWSKLLKLVEQRFHPFVHCELIFIWSFLLLFWMHADAFDWICYISPLSFICFCIFILLLLHGLLSMTILLSQRDGAEVLQWLCNGFITSPWRVWLNLPGKYHQIKRFLLLLHCVLLKNSVESNYGSSVKCHTVSTIYGLCSGLTSLSPIHLWFALRAMVLCLPHYSAMFDVSLYLLLCHSCLTENANSDQSTTSPRNRRKVCSIFFTCYGLIFLTLSQSLNWSG
jgi:hypothetical protein